MQHHNHDFLIFPAPYCTFLGKIPGLVIVEFHVTVPSFQVKSLQQQASGIGNLFITAASTGYKFSRCSEWEGPVIYSGDWQSNGWEWCCGLMGFTSIFIYIRMVSSTMWNSQQCGRAQWPLWSQRVFVSIFDTVETTPKSDEQGDFCRLVSGAHWHSSQ